MKSVVINQHDAGINDKINKKARPNPQNGKFLFFATGSPDLLLKGIEVDLQMTYTPDDCKQYLMQQLKNKNVIQPSNNLDLLIYLSGGIPFLGGTLNDLYNSKNSTNIQKYIYGILTRPISDDILNTNFLNLCDISDDLHKSILSPICDSSMKGLCDIACLLGYLTNGGSKSDKLLRSAAATIRFPPLITCLNRIIDRISISGRDVVTICSTFHTYFTYFIHSVTPPEKVFEYALRCCNMITHIQNIPENLPIELIDLKKESNNSNFDFLRELNQPPIVYFWQGDCNREFNYVDFDSIANGNGNVKLDSIAIENATTSFASFSPIAPLSIQLVTGCSIVRGKDHNYLYLFQSPLKKSTNLVDIIDPFIGKAFSVDFEEFAKGQKNDQIDDIANLIDPDDIKQIIMVCFDRSSSMNSTINGYAAKGDSFSRTVIATQYLTSFANKTYAHRIPCILGLISFSHVIEIRCPLSPLIPDFEEKGLKGIKADGATYLWDALSLAIDEINKFSKDDKGKDKFPDARKRIITISDGEDYTSKIKSEIVAKKLLENNILLDSVIVSNKPDPCKELAVLSHITGGLALYADSISKGMKFFEQSAFLEPNERGQSTTPIIANNRKTIPRLLTPNSIDRNLIDEGIKCVNFDTEVPNKMLSKSVANTKLSTPRSICFLKKDDIIKNPRQRRILRELHYAAMIMDNTLPDQYDPDLVVYPFTSNYDIWQVYMRAPDCEPYIGKWFFLTVNFPFNYPVAPPLIRFISIPYNMNISSEGRVCMNSIEKGYMPSSHVIDIIRQVKEIFLIPLTDTPVQIEVLDTYNQNIQEYERKAKESAERVGKDDYHDFFLKNIKINDNVDDDFVLRHNDKDSLPPYMLSQISGRAYKDPVVVPSTGARYEREELKQLIASSRNPVCIITGKPITETIDEIDEL